MNQYVVLKNHMDNRRIINVPVNLHLGCGGRHIDNCINIDFPQDEQPLVKSGADVHLDFTTLELPTESIDSIQLHHVFEHFSRGVALGLLCNWNRWLKPGGTLLITVPDVEVCAAGIASDRPLQDKMRLIRHIAGSHEEDKWSFHLDHWFEERLRNTFVALNFHVVRTKKYLRDNGLHDIDILATNQGSYNFGIMQRNVVDLLRESTLGPEEQPMLDVWMEKFMETINP